MASFISLFGAGDRGSLLMSGIARTVDQAPWKTADQLVVERQTQALHDRAHGQTLPVFMGTAPVEGIVFWRDGPRVETTTTTEIVSTWDLRSTSWAGWGLGETVTTTTTQVFVSFAVAHSFNQFQRAGELLKVEFDDIVIYDALEGIALPDDITMRVYDGIDNGFDPAMLAKDGAALTPAYHGLRYLFFEDVNLASFNGAIPASIRILWGDAATASDTPSTIPLLATTAAGYAQDFPWLCYDQPLNRFYNYYLEGGVDTDIWIGVTDFTAGEEISLAPLSNKPATSTQFLHGACAIPGTGMFICTALDSPYTSNWDMLVDADTGVIEATLLKASTEEVQWWAALPLGSKYVAAGRITASSAGGSSVFAFALVNVASPSISFLEFGTGQAAASNSRLTPGLADGTGTVFYMSTGGTGGTLYEVRFTSETAPSYTSIYTVSGTETIEKIYYDSGLDAVVMTVDTGVGNPTVARSIRPSSGAVIWEVTVDAGSTGPGIVPGGGAWSSDLLSDIATHRLIPGHALLRHGQLLYLVDVADGSFAAIEADGFGSGGLEVDHYDQVNGMVCALEENEWVCSSSTQLTAGTVTLADELTTFSTYDDDRGGLLTDAQVTTEGLAGIVNGGVIIDTDTDLRELASRLAELYGVLRIETATGVKWVKKATDGSYSPDVVLTEADLVEERQGEAVVKIATRDRNPREIPAEIEVRYISSDAGYEPMPARAAWPQGVYDTALSLLKRSLSVPVVLTAQQALELTWGVLGRERAANRTHSLKLRSNRLKVEPTDIFELTAGGQTIVGMFTRQTKLPGHALEMTAEGYLSRAATTVAAESPIVHEQPEVSFTTEHVFLDGPLLSYGHDGGGSEIIGYSVLTGLAGWLGGSLYRRRAGETNWTKVGDFAGARPVVGTLTAPLPASPWPFETDTENELTFRVTYGDAGDIAAQTETQFYEAASIIAVGAPGRWNFVTWRNVTVNGDGTITLDTLRQGLKGSEVQEGTSLTGDSIVLVKASQALLVPYALADIDQSVELKAVALGTNPNAAAATSFTVSGAADTPRAPGDLSAAIDGSDIDMTWARRSRLAVPAGGTFGDGAVGPLGADLDVYKAEILDGPGGTVVRTYADVAGEAKTYAAADIMADFGTIPDNLTFRVSQKTSITGIGYGPAAERSIALQ